MFETITKRELQKGAARAEIHRSRVQQSERNQTNVTELMTSVKIYLRVRGVRR